MGNLHSLLPTVLGLLSVTYCAWRWRRSFAFRSIPTIGYENPVLSYISATRFVANAKEIIQEGYDTYKPGLFKFALPDAWMIVAVGHKFIEEVTKAPDDVLSVDEAVDRALQMKYTLGRDMNHHPFHIDVIQKPLTRNTGNFLADMRDELDVAFGEYVPCQSDDWTSVPIVETVQRIVSRTTNRVFVGLPLCRHEDYIRFSVESAIDVVKVANVLKLFPDVLKPFVGMILDKTQSYDQRMLEFVGPVVEERLRKRAELGEDWDDKPNDMIQWLIDAAPDSHKTARHIANRMVMMNFVSIHTTSLTFTHALYALAAYPQYVKELRDEVEGVISTNGWTKYAIAKMRKLDSFILETQRLNVIDMMTIIRWTVKPFTFSDGTTVPAGAYVVCPSLATYRDDEYYTDPASFSPFRFLNDGPTDVKAGPKLQLVTTTAINLGFGHGRHACPGRFFAANEVKAMLAHVVLNYDVEFTDHPDACGIPPHVYFGAVVAPKPMLMRFRKRKLAGSTSS